MKGPLETVMDGHGSSCPGCTAGLTSSAVVGLLFARTLTTLHLLAVPDASLTLTHISTRDLFQAFSFPRSEAENPGREPNLGTCLLPFPCL